MPNTNVITIESNIPIPSIVNGRGCAEKYNFINGMDVSDSFAINGNTPDFTAVSVRAHVYGLNTTTDRTYTIRTLEGPSSNPILIRVWRTT
jgi:hypothetical protein